MHVFTATLIALSTVSNTIACAQEPFNLTLSGASPGGLLASVGKGVDHAVATAYPGSTITYQTSSGGLANIKLVSSGKVAMGIAIDGELKLAIEGKPPFASRIKNVRMLFRVYSPRHRFALTHVIVRADVAKEHRLESVGDIAKRKTPFRIAINRKGILDHYVSRHVLEESGVALAGIRDRGGQVIFASGEEMTRLMLDRRIDIAVMGIPPRHSRTERLRRGAGFTLLRIKRTVARRVAQATESRVCAIKKSEYPELKVDLVSVCGGAVVVANKSMPEVQAYAVTRALIQKFLHYKSAHRALRHMKPTVLVERSVVPLHPGAAQAFRDEGLIR